MKKYRLPIVIFLVILAGYYLLEPGNRYILLKYNSGNGYGHLYYHNGLWVQRVRLGSDFEMQLTSADLSPDGKKIVFENKGVFYTYHLPFGQITPISNGGINAYYADKIQWSPDGRQIGFVCTLKVMDSAEICIFDVPSQQLYILTEYHKQDEYLVSYFGSWGPNNDSIVYVLTTKPNEHGETQDFINIIDTKSRHVETILDETQTNFAISRDAAFSPDGETILFGAAGTSESYGNSGIYQINIDGSGLHKIIGMDILYLGSPICSPDGLSFYASSSDGNYFKPLRFNLNGKRLISIPFQYQRTLISWRNLK